MHMADALLSPAVGGAFWLAAAGFLGRAIKRIKQENQPAKTPLMAVMAAFIFAGQMINFSIPGTGSSGHLGGGLILAALLGPHRALVAMASVLVVQCLFFADGGILALGCNIFNMGIVTAYLIYPFVFKKILGKNDSSKHLLIASLTSSVLGLMLGAFCVVLQTTFSGISDLPFSTFILFMLPIHLAIGVVEGLMTWSVLMLALKTQPQLMADASRNTPAPSKLLQVFAVLALLISGVVSWMASSSPDGLEWSLAKVTGQQEWVGLTRPLHEWFSAIQSRTAFLPDYDFKTPNPQASIPNLGLSLSGLLGSLSVLLVAALLGWLVKLRIKPVKELS